MKSYIPDELYNRIEYPIHGLAQVGIDGILQEVFYKVPKAPELVVKKETWHSVCDFCGRTGALLEKMTGTTDIEINPVYGEFLRVVGCGNSTGKCDPFQWSETLSQSGNLRLICPPNTTGNYAVVSTRPRFDDTTQVNGAWTPKIPKYLIDWYGECIMHGALMRLFVMTHQPWQNIDLARMHAVAYNNDLNRVSFGLITSGMRKHLLVDIEDFIAQSGDGRSSNGNG